MRDAARMVIVVGASAGGVESLREVIGALPADLAAAVLVVLHVPPDKPSVLPAILGRCGPLRAVHAVDGLELVRGRIYVAPPGHDLRIEGQRAVVTRGADENRFSPSIDALFHSAAYHYGAGAIGVVLSGAMDDGTPGLWSIKRAGGTTVVEDPRDARFKDMPLSAMKQMQVDYALAPAEIGTLLGALARATTATTDVNDLLFSQRTRSGDDVVAAEPGFWDGVMEMTGPNPVTCSDCHGLLLRMREAAIGPHGRDPTDPFPAGDVLRTLEEGVMLLQHLARHMEGGDGADRAEGLRRKARQVEERANSLRCLAARR